MIGEALTNGTRSISIREGIAVFDNHQGLYTLFYTLQGNSTIESEGNGLQCCKPVIFCQGHSKRRSEQLSNGPTIALLSLKA